MIEIIQEGQAKPTIKLPRNLRQIGNPNGEHKIYVEDFVYTFLHPGTEEETGKSRVAILVGKQAEEEHVLYYFVKGAFYIEDISFEKGLPQFNEEIWGHAYKQMKQYFDDEDPDKSLQILGWSFVVGGMPLRMTTDIERIHRMNFKEPNTLLLLLDDVEREENFYVYEKGSLRKKEGYYIFYEQNPKMQEYMVQYREKKNPGGGTETVVDEPAKGYRERIAAAESSGRRHRSMIGYAACAVLVVSTLVMGVNSIGSYEKMNELQEAVSMIAGNFTEKEKEQKADGEEMVVTTVDGDVKPIDEPMEDVKETSAEGKKESIKQKPEETDGEEEKSPQQPEKKEGEVQKNPAEETSADPLSESEQILAQGYYIVESGDSLESISTKIYGNTSRVESIRSINRIENADAIFAGQKLNLP